MINNILDLLKTKMGEIDDIKEILFINKEAEETPQMIIQWDNSNENTIENLRTNMVSNFNITVRMPFNNEEWDVLFFNNLIEKIIQKINLNKTLDNNVENIYINSITPENSDEWTKKRSYIFNLEISYKENIQS